MRSSRSYQSKSSGTVLECICSQIFCQTFLWYQRLDEPKEPLSLWVLSVNFSTSLSVGLVICEKLSGGNLVPFSISTNLAEKLKIVVGINDSDTNICKSKRNARTWMNLSEITSSDVKPNVSMYNIACRGKYKHISKGINTKACHIKRCIAALLNLTKSILILYYKSREIFQEFPILFL